MTNAPSPQSNERLSYDADYWRGLYLTAIEVGNEIKAERDKLQAESQQLREVALEQWECNHAENCTNMTTRHAEGEICHWPRLPILSD